MFGSLVDRLDFDYFELLLSNQVLLMSLKAGGVGINLTAASNAFVMVCIMLAFHFSNYGSSCV